MSSVGMFADGISEQIRDYLPEEYREATFQRVDVPKNNGMIRSGVEVRMPGNDVGVIVYMEEFYKMVQTREDLDDVKNAIARVIVRSMSQQISSKGFGDLSYEAVKDHLTIALINTKANWSALEKMPHMKWEDLSVICKLTVPIGNGEYSGSMQVTDKLFEEWDIDEQSLFQKAIENAEEKYPPVLEDISVALARLTGEKLSDNWLEELPDDEAGNLLADRGQMYVLSNRQYQYGAATIVYPNVAEQLNKAFPAGYYILPSSVHECIVLPKDSCVTPRMLGEIVREINRTHVEKDEVLSDRVYEYDRRQKCIRQVRASIEERTWSER